jgi:undecaprenyl-diphosphatase
MLNVDHLVQAWIVSHRVARLDGAMWAVSAAAEGGVVWLALGALLAVTRRLPVRGLLALVLGVVIAFVAVDGALKPIVKRVRPYTDNLSYVVLGDRPNTASFPSGHAANAFAAASVLTTFVPAGSIAWWSLAAVVCYSRVYLGVHYPADVVAGALVGLLSAMAAMAAVRRIAHRRRGRA